MSDRRKAIQTSLMTGAREPILMSLRMKLEAMSRESQEHQGVAVRRVSKVLQTNELLQMIISEVPRKERTSLRHVSKIWQGAVEKVGYAFEPISYGTLIASGEHGLPMYGPPRTTCKVNWEWRRTHKTRTSSRDAYCLWYSDSGDPQSVSARLAGHELEFITDPPITQVVISADEKNTRAAVLRVCGGIRIGDVAEYCEKVRATNRSRSAKVSFSISNEGVYKRVEVKYRRRPGGVLYGTSVLREIPEQGPEPEDEVEE
jgi:hypothetical protein